MVLPAGRWRRNRLCLRGVKPLSDELDVVVMRSWRDEFRRLHASGNKQSFVIRPSTASVLHLTVVMSMLSTLQTLHPQGDVAHFRRQRLNTTPRCLLTEPSNWFLSTDWSLFWHGDLIVIWMLSHLFISPRLHPTCRAFGIDNGFFVWLSMYVAFAPMLFVLAYVIQNIHCFGRRHAYISFVSTTDWDDKAQAL